MKKLIKGLVITWIAMLFIVGCSSGNLDYVKDGADARWKEYGMAPVSYEGYQWGLWGLNNYGGAKVWYRLKTEPDNGINYTGYLQRWGDELHVYGPTAIDAIKP